MVEPIPVLLLSQSLGIGGSERQLSLIARHLDPSEFEAHVGCMRLEGVRIRELEAASVPIVHFPLQSFGSLSTLMRARDLGRYISKHRIRLVHSFDTPMNLFAPPVVRALSDAAIISSQRAHRQLTARPHRDVLRITDSMVDAIVVNCDFLRRHMVEDEKAPPARVHCCYNGLELARFSARHGEKSPEFRGASLVIGVVCALRPEKDLDTLLDAFAAVRHLREDMKLAIVGDGILLRELQSRAQSLHLASQCLFLPSRAEVTEVLGGIDVFVLPSVSEALSNSLMEAMACGCAAVASRVGGNPELIRHRETGLLFEPGNPAELAMVLRELVEDGSVRSRLAAAARRWIEERYSHSRSIEATAALYRSVLGRGRQTDIATHIRLTTGPRRSQT